jgi:acyl carrier protein
MLKMEHKLLEIINIIRENKSLEKIDSITPGMHLRNDIGFDSFDLAELTVRIEAEFDIDIFEDGIINTVGEILAKLERT